MCNNSSAEKHTRSLHAALELSRTNPEELTQADRDLISRSAELAIESVSSLYEPDRGYRFLKPPARVVLFATEDNEAQESKKKLEAQDRIVEIQPAPEA